MMARLWICLFVGASWLPAQQDTGGKPPKANAKMYTYKLKDGSTRQLDFPVYAEGQAPKVTKEIFKGYALYNSYCYRCHGTDATGGELAPDLRKSLNSGMRQQTFLSVAMAGRQEKGMPSWDGFLSRDDMLKVYRYVKARSLDLAPAGRPPSEQD
jgi:cytochrome c